MPYKTNSDLPKKMKDNLPKGAETISERLTIVLQTNIRIHQKEEGAHPLRKLQIKSHGQL